MNANEKRQFAIKYAQYERLLVLQGYAKATRDNYLRSLRRLADWAGKCPDQRLKKKHFEAYFTQRIQSHSWSAVKVDRNAFMRYWELVLDRDWDAVDMIKPPVVKHLPDILKANELNKTFACVHKTHYQVFLYTVYTLGIRLAEGLNLQVGDIDGNAMRVHIREGKGCKDRFVILPDNTYTVLQQFWRTHKNKKWLFPSVKPGVAIHRWIRGLHKKPCSWPSSMPIFTSTFPCITFATALRPTALNTGWICAVYKNSWAMKAPKLRLSIHSLPTHW